MADRYHVIIVSEPFSMEDYKKKGKNEYDLYEIWESTDPNQQLPSGVWFEEWYVPEGESWDSHPRHNMNELVDHEIFLIDWEEIGASHMIKDDKWWKEKIEMMGAAKEAMMATYPVAERIIDEVQSILDPENESIHEAMQGESYWPDHYTLGHWIWTAEKATEGVSTKTEESKDE